MPTVTGAVVHSGPPAMPTTAGRSDALVPSMPTVASTAAPLHLPPALPPARYRLGDEIARGGMGRVVEATDTVLGRVVAFKEALSTDLDTLRRFQRETKITATLEHPSIVPVHDAGESSNGAPFYVMRKVSGRPLERMVATADTLGQRLALIPHIVNSAQAIAHAHKHGIVHRDIKPSNILVGELGETVVIDWGLAKVIGEPDEQTTRPQVDLSDSLKTRAGIVYGTPGFMAPEQLRGAPVNEQCDVYALGATLYHLLSRKPPHYAKTADEMMKAAVAAGPTPIRELVAGVPPDLAAIVDKSLAHDPAVRYQDARALAVDLQRFLTGQLVAAHHYTPREKVVRFVRQNRGFSAAVAALLVIGSFAVIRIVIERNRADAARGIAETQTETAIARAEELTLTQARYNVDTNPTKAIAMVKPLATKYWRDVRAIAAAARATGVAWSVPAARHTLSLELSRDGRHALSAGDDGIIRFHDLGARTTLQIAALGAPVRAQLADDERQVVAWRGAQLSVVDIRTGKRRDLATQRAILDLEVVGAIAYWVDEHHALWQLDVRAGAPSEIALAEPVRALEASPDGRWIALAGENHLFVLDRTAPAAPPYEVMLGNTRQITWASDSRNFAALIDEFVIEVRLHTEPQITHRQTVGNRQFVAHGGGRMYTIGATGVAIMSRTERAPDASTRKQLAGTPVGLVESRGGTMIAGATSGLVVMSPDGDHILPLQAARIEAIRASARSPYVLAQLAGRILVWNLDDIQPRRLTSAPTGRAQLATADLVIAGGSPDQPAQAIEVATGATSPLGSWSGLRSISAARGGGLLAVIDDARRLHLVGPGRAPEDLPGDIDIAGFATDHHLVIATHHGQIDVYHVDQRRRETLIPARSQLIGLAWGRGKHPWIAAAFNDGALWRKNLVTGATATIPRIPPLSRDQAVRDSKLLVTADGTVVFVHANELHAWTPAGTFARIATAPKRLEDVAEAGPETLLAFAADYTTYTIARQPPFAFGEALPPIDATTAAMSAETGLVVVLEHGAIVVLDPLVHQRWTLAVPAGVTFANLAISPDGRRILAHTANGLLVWSLELPSNAIATAAWLEAMTNAVDDRSPGGLGWR